MFKIVKTSAKCGKIYKVILIKYTRGFQKNGWGRGGGGGGGSPRN